MINVKREYSIGFDLSCKLSIASFLCTLMVIYRHSLNHYAFFGDYPYHTTNYYIQKTVWAYTETAVPYFFIVSGFFFFGRNYDSVKAYLQMLQKKSRTLLLPYFLLSTLWGVPYYLTIGKEETVSVQGIIENFYYSNFYGPLWYVRDLFFMMLLVPVYYWIFKFDKWYIYAIVLIALFFNWNALEMSVPNTVGFFMFSLGGTLRRYSDIVTTKKNVATTVLFSVIWVILYSLPFWIGSFPYRYNLMMLSGIIAFWKLLDFLPPKLNDFLLKLAPYSFFLYVTHYYLEKIIKVVVGKMFFNNEMVALLTYFVLPIILVSFLVPLGMYFKKKTPRFYALLTGGR